jgi:hypothetical protein
MLPATADRVTRHTDEDVARDIREATCLRIAYYADHPDLIPRRLEQLDREWDIERCLETGAAALSLAGIVLGATSHRRWFLLTAVVQAFFLQHALEGWCPPLPLLRRLGTRTAEEIAQERYALKAIRGDFDAEGAGPGPRALAAVELA